MTSSNSPCKKKEIDPKEYTLDTIRTASGKRITSVLKRYWIYKNKKKKKEDIVDIVFKEHIEE
jgi:hypothetical protein